MILKNGFKKNSAKRNLKRKILRKMMGMKIPFLEMSNNLRHSSKRY